MLTRRMTQLRRVLAKSRSDVGSRGSSGAEEVTRGGGGEGATSVYADADTVCAKSQEEL
jgi:hypothetical protein